MKRFFIIPAILIILVSCTKKGDMQFAKVSAFVLNISGKVLTSENIDLPIEKWKGIKSKTEVKQGQYLRTREASTCDIYLSNGSVVKLGPLSVLRIDVLLASKTGSSKTDFNLKSGYLLAKPARLVSGESFTITTPTAIAGVRGTEFVVTHDNGSTSVAVKQGKVKIKRNIAIKKASLTNDASKKLATTAVEEQTLSSGQASTLSLDENTSLREAIKNAIENRPVKVEEIIKRVRIQRREPNVGEKKQFMRLGKIRRLRIEQRAKLGILLIFAGEDTKIFINGNLEGNIMVRRLLKTGTYQIKVTKSGRVIYDKSANVEARQRTVIRIAEPVFNSAETIFERRIRDRIRRDKLIRDRFRVFGQRRGDALRRRVERRNEGADGITGRAERGFENRGDNLRGNFRDRLRRRREAAGRWRRERAGGWQRGSREDRFRDTARPDRFRENN